MGTHRNDACLIGDKKISSQSFGAKRLRENLRLARPLRILEAHSPLPAFLAEEAAARGSEFDGFWSSSLSDSTLQGMPDMEILSVSERIDTARPIFISSCW